MSSVVTSRSQRAASAKARSTHSRNGVFLLALLLMMLLSQLGASLASLSTLVNVTMMVSIIMVWLDGFTTDFGLRRGLEETNSLLKALQKHTGNHKGLILSRMLPTAVILYIAFILQISYLLIPITAIFLLCNISNLLTIKNNHYRELHSDN